MRAGHANISALLVIRDFPQVWFVLYRPIYLQVSAQTDSMATSFRRDYHGAVRSPRRKIPSFSLYGEERVPAGIAQSTHIEDIPSRSRKYLWRIDTHRHQDLAQCVVVTSGPVTVSLEATERHCRGPTAILAPAGSVHSFRFGSDTTGYVLTVNLSKLLGYIAGGQIAAVGAVFAAPRILDLGDNTALSDRIASLLECLLREYRRPERLPDAIAACLAGAALSTVAQVLNSAQEAPEHSGTDLSHLREFRALVESNFAQHWPVSRYARKLRQSETTLNRLCLRLTGQTAFNLIQERLALEAQRRLIYSGATVSGIASELGFNDLAYFSRFFRRHHGMSPGQFRRRQGGGKVPMAIRIVQ